MVQLRCVCLLLMVAPVALAGDWPQWLGPKRDGGTDEKVKAWEEAPKVLWKLPVGAGHSVPVVADGRVFVHAQLPGKEAEEVIAVDATTGKEIWRQNYTRAPYKSVLNTGPQSTPVVSGGKLFTFGITGVLTCFDASGGKQLWQTDVYKTFKADLPRFGVCCSPLVVGNRVLVPVGGKGAGVVAFDTEKGAVQWQALDDPASTASPVLVAGINGPDVVFMTSLRLVALNPLDGEVSWEYPLVFQPAGASPTPLVVGDKLFASTMTNGTTAIRIGKKEDKPAADQVWQEKEMKGYFSSGTSANKERLYLITNTLKPIPSAALTCVDLKTGKQLWARRGVGYFHAAPLRTGDGNLLVLSDSGSLTLVADDPKEYRELARAKVCGGTLTGMAFSDGKLFVRDAKEVTALRLND
ncbi:PQQ-binding-like beta-propeller repeat protein [Zavarzinella formosa]|uniref:PQQ-binding-like beta-propeller repeat protein n=1 Tax=Zavarzinella formosa TaxID=360055 RepID=UPI0002E9131E|nr:PQQ-binding-like beta-propeller repeat protein [Zavarzinella formosa]